LLGIPEEDREQYRHAVDQGLNRDPEAAMDTTASVVRNFGHEYMARLIAARRKQPREDLVSVLAQAEYEDKHGVRRPPAEMDWIACTNVLAGAGAETTAKLLGHAIYLLWKHPDQRQSLWDDPSRIPHAIEETLRYEAPSQFQGRVALRDSTWHGVTIPAGKRV